MPLVYAFAPSLSVILVCFDRPLGGAWRSLGESPPGLSNDNAFLLHILSGRDGSHDRWSSVFSCVVDVGGRGTFEVPGVLCSALCSNYGKQLQKTTFIPDCPIF